MFTSLHRHPTPGGRRWAFGSGRRPVTMLATAGAATLFAVAAIAPVSAGVTDLTAYQRTGDEQIVEVAAASTSGIASRVSDFSSEVSPERMIAELTASRDQFAWAKLVLYYGGWTITDEKVAAITQWMRAENYPESWWLRNNPLNNGWGTFAGTFMSGYSNLQKAAAKAAEAIHTLGGYASIRNALAADSSAADVASGIIASSWAAGHYGSGSHWHTGDVTSYVAPDSAWGF